MRGCSSGSFPPKAHKVLLSGATQGFSRPTALMDDNPKDVLVVGFGAGVTAESRKSALITIRRAEPLHRDSLRRRNRLTRVLREDSV